jgi:hypothetical protein
VKSTHSYTFPTLTSPEKEKDEDYHKQFVQAIVHRSVSEGYSDRVAIANECVNFYLGLQQGEEFNFLQKAEDGDVLPATWMNYNRINTKINIMIGELSQKKYDIKVTGLNKDLTSRKLKERERVRLEFRFQPLAQELEQETGLPLQSPDLNVGFQPDTEEDIDDFFDKDYKDIAEIVVKAILKYLIRVNKWDYQRIAVFRDVLIQGMGFCRIEIIDGIPTAVRVDPRNMIWDGNATDDFLSDATYFGEVEYMTLGDAIDQYGLSEKEVKEAYEAYNSFTSGNGFRLDGQSTMDFGAIGDKSNLRFYKNDGGELRILVCRACWVDYKPYSNRHTTDDYGQEHIKRVSPEADGKDVKRTIIKTWRRGTLIGGKFMKQWGEMPNQARDWTHLANSDAPYKAIIPNYLNNAVVSKVHMMKSLQKLKDIALYRLQLDMARAGTKAFFYDVNQLPAGMQIQHVLKYMKTVGIIPIDSNGSGNPTGFNQFKDVDQTMSSNITAYLEISAMLDREMDAISGINEARQGMVKNASQAVGVTQSSLFQSSLSTALYYDLFTQFCSNVLSYQAKLAKLSWAGKERFAPIIGDSGVDFLSMDVDMDLHDYAVFVEEVPKMIQDEQSFQQIILAALQAGQLSFAQAMNLMLEKDIEYGVRKLEKETKKQLEQQAAQEEAMMQQQQQEMQMQQQEGEMERQARAAEQDRQYMQDMKKLLAQGRLDMKSQFIDFKKDIAVTRLNNQLKEKELKQKMAIDREKANLDINKAEKQLEIDEKKGDLQMKLAKQKAAQQRSKPKPKKK